MTKKTIVDNCSRLAHFFNDEFVVTVKDISAFGLIKLYCRMADFYGCPPSGMTILFLEGEEFDEVNEYVLNISEDFKLKDIGTRPSVVLHYKRASVFKYNTFTWEIIERQTKPSKSED